jgi:hypothetical protein
MEYRERFNPNPGEELRTKKFGRGGKELIQI